MRDGLMWADFDPKRTFAEKVARAAEHYTRKFGRAPDTCVVHPATEGACDVDGVRVTTAGYIRPGHLWIGVETSVKQGKEERHA